MEAPKPIDANDAQEVKASPGSSGRRRRRRMSDECDIFTCCVCLENMVDRQPRTLTCMHTFCTHCLQCMQIGVYTVRSTIQCPKCRKQTPVPSGTVANLPINCDLAKMQERERELAANDSLCKICLDIGKSAIVSDATHFCSACSHKFCEKCASDHAKIPAYSSHRLMPLASASIDRRCTKHDDVINSVCQQCLEPLCVLCVHSKDHESHLNQIQDFDEGMKSIKESNLSRQDSLLAVRTEIRKYLDELNREQQVMTEIEQWILESYQNIDDSRGTIEERRQELEKLTQIVERHSQMINVSNLTGDLAVLEKIKQGKDEVDKSLIAIKLVLENAFSAAPAHTSHTKMKSILSTQSAGEGSSSKEHISIFSYRPVGDCLTFSQTSYLPQLTYVFELNSSNYHYRFKGDRVYMIDREILQVLKTKPAEKIQMISTVSGDVIFTAKGDKSILLIKANGQLAHAYNLNTVGECVEKVAIHQDTMFIVVNALVVKKIQLTQKGQRTDLTDTGDICRLEPFDFFRDNITDMVVPDGKHIVMTTCTPGTEVQESSGKVMVLDANLHRYSAVVLGLNNPKQICSAKVEGQFWHAITDVTETGNYSVILYNERWTTVAIISQQGQENFGEVTSVNIAPTGHVLISDGRRCCVEVYHLNGRFCRKLLTNQDITKPIALAYSPAQLWVLQEDYISSACSVKVFAIDGMHNLCCCRGNLLPKHIDCQ